MMELPKGLSERDKIELEMANVVGRRALIQELAAIHALRAGPSWPEVLDLELVMRLQARAREIRDALIGTAYSLPPGHESDRAALYMQQATIRRRPDDLPDF